MAVLRSLAETDSRGVLEMLAALCATGRVPEQPDLAVSALNKTAGLGCPSAPI